MKRVLVAVAAVVALGASLIAGTLAPTAAQDGTVAVYAVHGISDATLGGDSEVDVYAVPADAGLAGADPTLTFSFEDVAGPLNVPAGAYDVFVYPAGATPADDGSDALLDLTTPALPAGATAAIVAHVAEDGGSPQLTPFVLDTSPTAAGNARAQAFHTAGAPPVDVQLADGTTIVPGLVNAAAGAAGATHDPLEVPAGSYALQVFAPSADLTVPIGSFDLAAGTASFVFAIGGVGDESFTVAAIGITVGEAAAPAPPAPAPTPDPVTAAPHFTG